MFFIYTGETIIYLILYLSMSRIFVLLYNSHFGGSFLQIEIQNINLVLYKLPRKRNSLLIKCGTFEIFI